MNALELTLIRIGFLAVLWLFVIAAVGVVRTDLFGQVSHRRRRVTTPSASPPQLKPADRPPRPSRAAPQHLLVTAGALAGTTLGLTDQQITIGRADDATLVLADDYASTRHARLFPQDGQWLVEDLGSTNGTYLNEELLETPRPLHPGDRVRIGDSELTFEID